MRTPGEWQSRFKRLEFILLAERSGHTGAAGVSLWDMSPWMLEVLQTTGDDPVTAKRDTRRALLARDVITVEGRISPLGYRVLRLYDMIKDR